MFVESAVTAEYGLVFVESAVTAECGPCVCRVCCHC